MGRAKRGTRNIKNREDEQESTYYRIYSFASKEQERRAREAYNNKEFDTMEEAMKNTSFPNVFSVVKSIALKRQLPNTSIEAKIEAIKYVVTNIMGITPMQFFNIWSTENNKQYYLYPTINAIINAAPSEYWKECYFDAKLVFFKMVWEDVYEKRIENVNCYDVYYCKDSIKAALKHAGTPATGARRARARGSEVDEIMMNAICDMVYDKLSFDNAEEIFEMLAADSRAYIDSKRSGKNKLNSSPPGICEVIEARGYGSLYDFFYLKCPERFQLMYADEFLDIRRKYKLPPEPLLETAIETLLEANSKEFI